MVLLVVAIVIGCINLFVNDAEVIGTSVNIAWAVFDLVILSVVFPAVNYQGFAPRSKGK
jgi:cellulose synthase (UDP-forming)